MELVQYLPPKHEYILYIRLTNRQVCPVPCPSVDWGREWLGWQRDLYQKFIATAVGDTDAESLKGRHILPDFHQFSRIWLHPYALIQHKREDEARQERIEMLEEEAEFVAEDDDEELCSDSDEDKKKKKKGKNRWEPDSEEDAEEEVVAPATRRTRGNPGDSPSRLPRLLPLPLALVPVITQGTGS